MSLKRSIIIATGALSIIVVIGWSLVQFAGLQTSLLWTAIVGALAWAIRSSIEQKREHQRLLAERKREHYLAFLEFLNRFVKPTTDGNSPTASSDPAPLAPGVPLEEFRMWSLRLTLIGSDEVVRAWNNVRLNENNVPQADNGVAVIKKWGKLWLAMRKDCGHIDTKLHVTEVLASFVNDIEQHRKELDND